MNLNLLFSFIRWNRNIVRLGEHELGTTKDGIHQDIPVVRVKQHKSFNSYLMTDDIAIVYLERDVEFTGFKRNHFT